MAQVDRGLRSLLAHARNYDLLQNALGAERVRSVLVREYLDLRPGMSVLDVGCGTASLLAHLPAVRYLGFDMNPRYIEAARARFGARGTFLCANVNAPPAEAQGPFDRILATFVLHHLDDAEVLGLLRAAQRLLAPGGRVITADPCYRDGQSRIARLLIDRDRGRNVRSEAGYASLARSLFRTAETSLREDLMRVPYTHLIMSCSEPLTTN